MKHGMHIGIFMINASQEYTVTSYTRDWTNWNMYTKKRTISFFACCNHLEESILMCKVNDMETFYE